MQCYSGVTLKDTDTFVIQKYGFSICTDKQKVLINTLSTDKTLSVLHVGSSFKSQQYVLIMSGRSDLTKPTATTAPSGLRRAPPPLLGCRWAWLGAPPTASGGGSRAPPSHRQPSSGGGVPVGRPAGYTFHECIPIGNLRLQ